MEHFKDVHVCGESLPEDDFHGATGVNCKDDGVKSLHLAQQTPTVAKSEKRRLQNRKAQKIYSRLIFPLCRKATHETLSNDCFNIQD